MSNNSKITGSVVSPGSITTNSGSTIGGDVWAGGNVTLDNSGTTVTGNVYSGGNVTLTGSVKGNIQAAGTVGAGGTVAGYRTSQSPPTSPPSLTLPTFTWNAGNYPSALSWASPSDFKTYWTANKTSFGGAHRVLCTAPCSQTLSLDSSWTMNGDVTIVSDSPVTISRDVSNGTSSPVTLTIVSFSSTSPAISMTNNITLPQNIRVVLYAPNASASFSNLKNFAGVVYAKGVSIGEQFSLTYVPVSVPGFAWDSTSSTHFSIQNQVYREVQFS
jgi:hypothetical protein